MGRHSTGPIDIPIEDNEKTLTEKEVEAKLDEYWDKVHKSKTPALVELFNLKEWLKQNW